MEMDEMHRKILHDHRRYLIRNLEPMKLLPYLNTVLDESDRQEMEQERTVEKKVVKLLDMLPKRGPDAFDAFMKALEEKQEFIARCLKPETDLADKSCSHCAKLEEDLNMIRSEKKKLEKDVLDMNNKIKGFSNYRKQEKQKVQQELENLKNDLQEVNRRVAAETENQVQEIANLQKQNQELRNEREQKICKINELSAQLTRKNDALKKTHKELKDEKENGKKVKGKLEAVRKEKRKAMEENEKLNKKLNKQDECYSHCEKLKEELNLIKTEKENLEKEVASLQKERESHSRCEELQRTLNVITGERDSIREQKQNLDEEVLRLHKRIKEISEDNHLTSQKAQQIFKEKRENQKEGQSRYQWALHLIPRKRGVVYPTDFGKRRTREKGSSTPIIATRSSDFRGKAEDPLGKEGKLSGTRDEENICWRVDLHTTPNRVVGTIKSHTSLPGAWLAPLKKISEKH